ncbi:GNAT family N-acetyltransferase [Marivita sp. S2033]|uniref:GNAT family N-acetyltransferase n=1 Tax=Marivita sp. S2033 TaxID=3373187 RepID=UPI003981F898
MTPTRLTTATDETLAELSDLCMRSKAYWGYDAAFMAACRDVLRLTQNDLATPVAVTREGASFTGVAQLDLSHPIAALTRLFVCPNRMGKGIGTALIRWAKAEALSNGYLSFQIDSDPQAVPFYLAHGATQVGDVASDAIPGRRLPLLEIPTTVA